MTERALKLYGELTPDPRPKNNWDCAIALLIIGRQHRTNENFHFCLNYVKLSRLWGVPRAEYNEYFRISISVSSETRQDGNEHLKRDPSHVPIIIMTIAEQVVRNVLILYSLFIILRQHNLPP